MAQAIVGRLVGEQRVEDEGPRPQARLEGLCDGLGRVRRTSRSGAASRLRAMSSETVSSSSTSSAEVSSSNRRPQALRPVSAFSEKTRSSGSRQQVRTVAAGRPQVVGAEVEPVAGEQLLGPVVVEGGPLELEEQQHRLERGPPLLDPLHQGAALGVGGVGREAQLRV